MRKSRVSIFLLFPACNPGRQFVGIMPKHGNQFQELLYKICRIEMLNSTSAYSYFNASTAFAFTTLNVCMLTDKIAMIKEITSAITKG